MKKITITIFCILIAIFIANYINLKSPIINNNGALDVASCIDSARDKKTLIINSNGIDFKVNYVENARENCTNPHFPAIHIVADTKHEYVWLHLVYTDNKDPKYQRFIDGADPIKYPEIYPFYTKDRNF